MCNFMIPQYMNDWKLVGIQLGLHAAWLEAIETEKLNKADKCCYEMLAKWLEFDPSATIEKLKKIVHSLSGSMVSPFHSIVNFKEYLQQKYANMHAKNVVNTLVTEESMIAVAKAMYYGKITIKDDKCNNQCNDCYARCVKSTNILEMLNDLNSASDREPFLLLIEGMQGIGKTTICKEIAFQWAKQQGPDGEFTFLICLDEINLEHSNSLEAVLEYLCPKTKATLFQNVMNYLHSSRGDKVMVIIDGYENLFDHHKNSAGSFIHKIIKREILELQKCDLVISSYHSASVILHKCDNYSRIELLGFTEEAKQQYIKFALDPNGNNTTECDELMAYLKKHRYLYSFCYYPLCLKELISLFRECKRHNKELSEHETEIINIVTNHIVLCLSQSQEKNFLPLTDEIDKMSEEYRIILHKISKLALSTLQAKACICKGDGARNSTKEYMFRLEDIKSDINAADMKKCFANGLGILKVMSSLENTDINQKLFTFLHVSLHEFLAAFYISTLSEDSCIGIWNEYFWNSKFINVWAYCLGITRDFRALKKTLFGNFSGEMGIQNLQDDILTNKMKCLYLVHCLMEFPNNEIYGKVKSKVIPDGGILDMSHTKVDFDIVVSFLSRCNIWQWTCLDLSYCCIDDNKLALFLQRLQLFVTSLPSIKELNLSGNHLSKGSLHNVFEVAAIFNTADINLSHNAIKDQEICKNIAFLSQKTTNISRIKVIQNSKSAFLIKCQDLLQDFKFPSSLTCLYIIRCSLENDTIDRFLKALKLYEAIALVLFYDNEIIYNGLVRILDELEDLKQLKNVLIFDKTSNINIDELTFEGFLLSTNKLVAHNVQDHHILMALEYNPSVVHVQLNDCHITKEVMNKIAVILNNSSQQWSLLDLSGSEVNNSTLRKFCKALNCNTKVAIVKLARNRITSLSLIVELIQCLQPNAVDISGNCFMTDDSKRALIGIFIAVKLFACENQLHFNLTYDKCNILICHKLDIITELKSEKVTQVFINDCAISGELLIRSLYSNDLLTFLHLGHVKWIGEPLYKCTKFFEKDIFFSICDNTIPEDFLSVLLSRFDININVSMIVSSDDILISHKCNDGLLKWHITQKLLQLPANQYPLYIENCLIEKLPHNLSITTEFKNEYNLVTEIMLYNNRLNENNINTTIARLQKIKLFRPFLIYELQKQISTMTTRWLLNERVVIGRQATSQQVGNFFTIFLPIATVVRFISCQFSDQHYNTLVNALTYNHDTALEEFSLYECNTNEICTKQLAVALQMKSTLTSLLFSCNKVTPIEADRITTALSTVIINNPSLEKVSFKFDNLHPSACGKIFESLSRLKKLRHLRFCDGQVTTEEAVDQLVNVIKSNSLLEIVNLRNNKMQSSKVKVVATALKTIQNLRMLALNGNQIDEEAADDIASIIANNKHIVKLLLHNNNLKSEGVRMICKVLKCHTNLQIFRISHNDIHEEAAGDIADVIKNNPSLKTVDVGSNRLLTNGIVKITRSFEKLHNLQILIISKNLITCDCTMETAYNIARVIKDNKHLKVLRLDNNDFSSSNTFRIAEALNKHTNLRELTINNTGCTADHIIAMITNNLLLEILDIGDNKLKPEGISHISKALMKLSHLKLLGLYGNEITDDVADDIAEVICKLPVLENLQLNNNAFGTVGIQAICKSLQHNGALKYLQLDNVGITEEVANDIAVVIDSNPLLDYLYLGGSRLQNVGALTILKSLKDKQHFKALGLDSNCISQDVEVLDYITKFVTSNPDLEVLLLNNNSIGTDGVIKICECVKNNTTLKVLNLADNNVGNEAAVPIVSAIELNTTLENLSLSGNITLSLDNNKFANIIATLNNLKCLKIDCKLVTENIYKLVDLIFAKCHLQEITINYLSEEIHFLSSLTAIETVLVIKVNVDKLTSHMPPLHSVVIGNRAEIVCTKDDILAESKVIGLKSFKRLTLVITKMNSYTDQELDVLTNAITVNCKSIDLLIISKLDANSHSDMAGVVTIEENEITITFTGDSLKDTGIIKLLNKIESIKSLILCTERTSTFDNHCVDEIVDILSKTSKLENFALRKNLMFAKAMKFCINYLTKFIAFKTQSVLNNIGVKCFDFAHKHDKPGSQSTEEIDKHRWGKLFSTLKRNSDLKALNLSSNAINEEVAQCLSFLLDGLIKLEMLSLEDCSLTLSLKIIQLQKITTLKYLDLSNNHLTKIDPILAVIENNPKLNILLIDENCFHPQVGDKLGIAIRNLKNLKILSVDQNIIGNNMTHAVISKSITASSSTTDESMFVHINHHMSSEAIYVTGSLCNVTKLTLCKSPNRIQEATFLAAVSKAGVVSALWHQDNAVNRAGFIKLLSASRKITTIELVNVSFGRLTKQEEDAIATIIRENTQLENVMLGSQSYKLAIDDFRASCSARNIDGKPRHESTSESIKTSLFLSHEFLIKSISALQNNPNLKTLDLSFLPSTKKLTEQLAIVLRNSTKMERLLIGDCSLGNESVREISNSLKNTTTLKHLNLSSNDITEEDQIVEIIKANSELEELHLQKNLIVGNKLSVSIATLKNLKVLSIDQNVISRDLVTTFSTESDIERTLFIYNNDNLNTKVYQIVIRGSLNKIHTLTLMTHSDVRKDQPIQTFILDNGSLIIWFTKYNVLSLTGVVRFLNECRNIPTIKFLNAKGTKFTEQEADTIATIFSESVKLENLWLGIKSVHTIDKDISALTGKDVMKELMSNYEFIKQWSQQFVSADEEQLKQIVSPHENKLKQFISPLKDDQSTNELNHLMSTLMLHNKQIVSPHENRFKNFISFLKDDQSTSEPNNIMTSRMLHMFPNQLLLKVLSTLPYNTNLKTLDISGYVITKEIVKRLAIVLSNSTRLETLLFQHCSLDNKGFKIVCECLKNITTLKYLNLSNNNITEVLDIVNVLQSNTKLKEIYFHLNHLDLCAGYIISVCALKLKTLEVLSIDQNIISRHMALQLANAFATDDKLNRTLLIYNHQRNTTESIEIRQSLYNINTLTLCKFPTIREDLPVRAFVLENGSAMLWWSQHNELKTTGVLRFLSSFKITSIKLCNESDSELTELEVDTIATVINENKQLEKVWLGSLSLMMVYKDFSILSHKKVSDSKENSEDETINKFIPYISISGSSMSGKQVTLIPMKKLFPNTQLVKILHQLFNIASIKTLDLSGNVITEELAKKLAVILNNSTKLKTLLLEDCSLGDKGVRIISKFLRDLKRLDLSNNGITDDQTLSIILRNNPTLEKLYFERNYLHTAVWDSLSHAIMKLKCLRVLSINQNIINIDMPLKLEAAFSAASRMTLYMYNHDPHTIDVMQFRGNFKINTLIMCKFSNINEMDGPSVKVVLENGMTVIKYNVINTTGVLKFLNSFKKINTIKCYNISKSELTELEVKTIATVISKNMQLENVLLGLRSAMTLFDDLKTLPSDSLSILFGTLNNKYYILASKDSQSTNQFNMPDKKLVQLSCESLLKLLFALKSKSNLKTLDLSGYVITEDVAEQLATVLANCTKLEMLLLEWCSLSINGVHLIANSLKNITTLRELRLSWDDITEVVVDCIATVLECNVGLRMLYLDGNLQGFNKLSDAIKKLINLEDLLVDYQILSKDNTCELINSLISTSKMKSLKLKNYSLQVTGMVSFQILSKNIKLLKIGKLNTDNKINAKHDFSVAASVCDSGITISCFGDNVLTSTGILKLVCAFEGVKSIHLHNFTPSDYTDADVNEIGATVASFADLQGLVMEGCTTALQNKIFHSLIELNSLLLLTLSSGRIHTNAVDKLAAVLCNNTIIKELRLRYCLLKSSQAVVITNALKMHTDITSLDLYCNNITGAFDVADNIGQIILNNPNIQNFFISTNRLQAKGMIKILGALKQLHKLKWLTIGDNNIMDHGDSTIMTRLYDFLIEVINNNPKLEVLAVNYVCMYVNAAAQFVQALKSLSFLKILMMPGNNINEEAADDVATVIINNSGLVRLYLADNHLGAVGISKIAQSLIDPRGLEILDITNNNVTSEAAESISKIIQSNPQLKSLLLGEVTIINMEGIHQSKLIPNDYLCSGVSTVKLANRFINKQVMKIKECTKYYGPKYPFVSSLSFCCHKVSTDLLAISSNNIFDSRRNRLQSEGIKRICKALATIKSLQILSIENNDITDKAVNDIATTLVNNSCSTKQFWIGQNKFTPSGISVILQSLIKETEGVSKDDLLEILDLSHSNLSQDTVVDISTVLSKNMNIQQLWLDRGNFSLQSIATLSTAIKNCVHISILSLRDNNISEEAVYHVSQAVTKKISLQQLYLGNNQLEDGGVIKITEALITTPGLLTLDLMNNNISEAAADALASVIISCRQLEQLYLGDNKLHSTGTIKIASAIPQAACRSTLRVLDLSNNKIGSDERVADEISRAVGNTELLTVLILDDNALSVDGLLKITRSLGQSDSAEYMMIFSVMRNNVMINEEAKDEMRAVMADQQLTDCVMYF